jgi:hypothetical protein
VQAAALRAAVAIAPADDRVVTQINPTITRTAASMFGNLEPVPIELIVEAMQHPDRDTAIHATNALLKHGKDGREAAGVVLTSPCRAIQSLLAVLEKNSR